MNYRYLVSVFTFEKYLDLETWVRGHSKSLEITPFDRS